MELYLYFLLHLSGMQRGNFTFIFADAVLFKTSIVMLVLKTAALGKMNLVPTPLQ
jgi:hypothetical protein